MRRFCPTCTEVVRRRDKPVSKMIVPHAIRHDARGQRVAWVRKPIGESPAALSLGSVGAQTKIAAQLRNCGKRARRDDFLRCANVTALEAMSRFRLFANACVGGGQSWNRFQFTLFCVKVAHELLAIISLLLRECRD